MNEKKFEAVIFDMDGVLIDSEPVHDEAIRMVLHLHADEIPDGHTVADAPMPFDGFGTTVMDDFRKYCALYPYKVQPEEMLQDYIRMIHRILERDGGYPAMPHVKAYVRNLHAAGLKLAVASSSTMQEILENMEAIDLADCFDRLASGADLPKGKPDPAVFLHAAKLLGVEPENCVVVEDTDVGLTAAKAAGMAAIGFVSPHTYNQTLALADLVVEGFEEMDAEATEEVWTRVHAGRCPSPNC